MVGGSTAFYVAYLAEQRKNPYDPILPSLRVMTGGGAAKPPEIHYEVRDEIGGRGVVHGYGMTEVPMISNGSPHDTDEQLANTDGKPVEGAEVRIVTLDGRVAGPGEEGEVGLPQRPGEQGSEHVSRGQSLFQRLQPRGGAPREADRRPVRGLPAITDTSSVVEANIGDVLGGVGIPSGGTDALSGLASLFDGASPPAVNLPQINLPQVELPEVNPPQVNPPQVNLDGVLKDAGNALPPAESLLPRL